MDFRSDNVAGVAPAIMAALADANKGSASSYGADEWSKRLQGRFNDIFEREVAVFPVATGTAANALALAQSVPPWGQIYCHALSHIQEDECGAPEFFSGGARLALLDGPAGRISAAALDAALRDYGFGVQHHAQPKACSISQASECGTVYPVSEIAALAETCRRYGLALHMDGARFANALCHLQVSAADLTWRAGLDVLSFGATKNGAMAAEAVIFFDPSRAQDFLYRRKRSGHLFSKMRFLSAQLVAYLENDLWLDNARHANAMARALADGLSTIPGAQIVYPVQANEVFVRLPPDKIERLQAAGAKFHPWQAAGPNAVRLVCAFDTKREAVAEFLKIAATAVAVS